MKDFYCSMLLRKVADSAMTDSEIKKEINKNKKDVLAFRASFNAFCVLMQI